MILNNFTRTVLLVTLSLTLSLLLPLTARSERPESDALTSFAPKLSWVHYRREIERYRLAVDGRTDSLAFFEGLYTALLVDIDSSWGGLQGDGSGDSSARLKRLLGHIGAVYRIEQSKSVSSLRDSLADMLGSISGLLVDNNGSPEDSFRRRCAKGNNADEILMRLIKERNRLARREGYTDFYTLSALRAGFSVEALQDMFVRALQSSEVAYNNAFNGNGNPAKPELWDIGNGVRRTLGKFDPFFPGDSHLGRIKEMLSLIGFDISALPLFIEETSEQGKLFSVKPPSDIRIIIDSTGGVAGFERTAGLLSKGIALSKLDKGRGLFGILSERPWEIAMERLLVRLYRLPESLSRLSGMSPGEVRAFLDASRTKDIIDARKRILESEFEYQLYMNPNQDVSNLYWQLCDKELGVVIHDDLEAWKVSAGALIRPLSSANALAGEISAEQIVSALSLRLEHPTANSKSASFLIQNFYRFGSRYPWREILLRGTDEQLNPDYLLKEH